MRLLLPSFVGFGRGVLALALVAIVAGLRLIVIDRFGSDVPVWDQWDGEADAIYLPYFQGRLGVGDFFGAYHEHRILFTRLLSLGLVALNETWDARLQCVVNALGYSVVAAAVFWFGDRLIASRFRSAWFGLVVIAFGFPLSWNNMIYGFHSAQFFLIGFSLAGCALLVTGAVGSRRWVFGLICTALAPLTLASGLLTPLAVAAAVILCRGRTEIFRRDWITIATCGVIVAVHACFWATAAEHATLRAGSVGEFALSFWRCLQWPVNFFPLFPLLGWLPWTALVWRCVRRRETVETHDVVLVAVGAWVVLQAAAMAFSRGAGAHFPTSRYLDTLAIGIAVNGLSALLWLAKSETVSWRKNLRNTAVAVGVVLFIAGLWVRTSAIVFETLPEQHAQLQRWKTTLRVYLKTDDPRILEIEPLMYHTAEVLRYRLSFPELRAILPASLVSEHTGKFSSAAAWLARSGAFIALAGIVAAALAFSAERWNDRGTDDDAEPAPSPRSRLRR